MQSVLGCSLPDALVEHRPGGLLRWSWAVTLALLSQGGARA